MPVHGVVRPATYRDSVVLLRLAQALRALPGVDEVAAVMGTPANQALLTAAGLATDVTARAGPADLIVAVAAASAGVAAAALAAVEPLLAAPAAGRSEGGARRPRRLPTALVRHPDASLVAISVPGAFAALEARRALRAGRHVFLFSDNVSLADEVELKRLARARGRLCMGPDCGTAYIAGVGLGFANVVPRGRVGIVAASGTGLQAVVSHLAVLGEGVAHGIGVGGRDLSVEVGGSMTQQALAGLARDAATTLVVLVAKPPAPSVLPGLEAALAGLGKPAVVCCLGAPPRAAGTVRWVETTEDAARCAAARLAGVPWQPRAFTDPAAAGAALVRLRGQPGARGPGLLGLYTGGTLAHETRIVLAPHLGPIGTDPEPGAAAAVRHRVLDLGADEFTVGRAHPMLDPDARVARVRAAGRDGRIGVLLLDLVLGRGAHPDPAGPLAPAVEAARRQAAADGRALAIVASVVGTVGDPQGLARQVAALEAAGVAVLPSNAQAARLAALLLRPDLGPAWLGDHR